MMCHRERRAREQTPHAIDRETELISAALSYFDRTFTVESTGLFKRYL